MSTVGSNCRRHIFSNIRRARNIPTARQLLEKELIPANQLNPKERPLNQHWSWDRILRSPYIKQADVLQGFYMFAPHFTEEELERHYEFYEPFTVHESSLSSSIHAVIAARLNRMDEAYDFLF